LSALFIATATSATGCIFVDDDDGDDGGGDDDVVEQTELAATWNLFSNATPAFCRADTTAVTFYACEGDCDINGPRPPFSDVFDCDGDDSTGTLTVPSADFPDDDLAPGRYTVWLEFAVGNTVYAKSFAETVTLAAGRRDTVTFDIQVDHGFFDATYSLVEGTTAVTCQQAGGVEIELLPAACNEPRQPGNECVPLTPQISPCSTDLTLGTTPVRFAEFGYTATYALLDANDLAIGGGAQELLIDEPFEYGNEGRNLGTLVIEVD
jgi:hypothetical protein